MREQDLAIESLLRRIEVLETREDTIDSGWIGLPYNTGWQDYSTSSIFVDGEYRKVGEWVYLRGLVERASGSSGTIAVLPTGFRPSMGSIHGAVMTSAFARITIYNTGQIIVSGTVTTSDWVGLNGVYFSTV